MNKKCNTNMTSTEKKMFLKNKRKELGMTQQQFAEILGLRYETYRKYEATNKDCRHISDGLFEIVTLKIQLYEKEHEGEIIGKICISRFLECNRNDLICSFSTRNEREIAGITLDAVLEIIREVEKHSRVPYLMVQK